MAFTFVLTLLALIIEAVFGYSQALFKLIGHPVTWLGKALSWLDEGLNWGSERRLKGALALFCLLALAGIPAYLLQALTFHDIWGVVKLAILGSTLLAQRSLYTHVKAVSDGLAQGLSQGRQAVSQIVGRNPDVLDESGVARAAIESLAENFSDGIVAPAFWMAMLGLPGAALYKAANTADSMIGHKNMRYLHFGWAAARFDDLINLPASRLAALWIIAAAAVTRGARADAALLTVWDDAGKHRSPNAGWPEAAMAGALGLQLAGPRQYGDELIDDATMGSGRRAAGRGDIDLALKLYWRACLVQLAVVGGLAAALA